MRLLSKFTTALVCLLAMGFGPASSTTVSAGYTHSCSVSDARQVNCWGAPFSQLPAPPFAQDVRAGRDFSCALFANGYVTCWGNNDFNQLGSPKPDARGVMVVSSLNEASQISAGARHACAVTASSVAVVCWGDASQGQQGEAISSTVAQATRVPGFKGWFTRVAAGSSSTCAVEGGRVWCVGSGSMLAGALADPRTPRQVPGISDALDVSIFEGHACVLRREGKVSCWGNNPNGELGVPAGAAVTRPVDVVGLKGPAKVVTVGMGFSCALLEDRSVQCWGTHANGQLGVGASLVGASSTPTRVLGISDAVALSAGASHACAALEGGYINCWGGPKDTYHGLCQPWGAFYPNETYRAPTFSSTVCSESGSSTPYAVLGLGPLKDAGFVMDWAEKTLPQLFPGDWTGVPEKVESYYWRPYEGGRYLAVNGHGTPHLMYLGPDTGGQLRDLGPLTQWMREATKYAGLQSGLQFQSPVYVTQNCSFVAPIFVRRGVGSDLAKLIPTSVRVEWADGAFVELPIGETYGVLKLLTTEEWFSSLDVYQEGAPIPPGKLVESVYWGAARGCPKPGVFGSGEMVDVALFYILDGKKGQLRTRAKLIGVP